MSGAQTGVSDCSAASFQSKIARYKEAQSNYGYAMSLVKQPSQSMTVSIKKQIESGHMEHWNLLRLAVFSSQAHGIQDSSTDGEKTS